LFYRARQFSEEAKDCSENNNTATNFVKSASGDFQCTREEAEEETASSLPARKRKPDQTFLEHTHTHTHTIGPVFVKVPLIPRQIKGDECKG
jgi:hypothetical protein